MRNKYWINNNIISFSLLYRKIFYKSTKEWQINIKKNEI